MSTKLSKPSSTLKLAIVVTMAATIIATSVFTAGFPRVAAAQVGDDSTAIRAQVEAYEKVFNTHDPSALAAFFTDDADMIMGNQPITRGRQAIHDWWQNYFSIREQGLMSSFIINSVRLITTDVALINVDYTSDGRNAQSQEMPTRKARGTWVVVRKGGDWLISALRGMPTEDDSIIRGGGR